MTVHSSRSLTISLRDNQTKYVCYCAEWMERGRDKAAFMSYYSPHASRKLNLESEGTTLSSGLLQTHIWFWFPPSWIHCTFLQILWSLTGDTP